MEARRPTGLKRSNPGRPRFQVAPEQLSGAGEVVHVSHARTDEQIDRSGGEIRAGLAFRVGNRVALPHPDQHRTGDSGSLWRDRTVGGPRTEFENGLRYEQLVRAKGTLRIGAEEWDFTGSCSRIHRQGFRNLTGFEGHVWQSALFPSGRGFGHMWLLPNNYKEGYIFDGTRMLPAEVVEVSWMTKMYPSRILRAA